MKRTLLVSTQSSFTFPLAEAVRKQMFAEALAISAAGGDAAILIISSGHQPGLTEQGIPISFVTKREALRLRRRLAGYDEVYYYGSIGLYALLVGFASRKKVEAQLVITCGGLYSIGGRVWIRKLIGKFLHRYYNQVHLYTEHQKQTLLAASFKYAPLIRPKRPLLEALPARTGAGKSSIPTLLYMGHISTFKGIDIVLSVFEGLVQKIENLQVIFAINGVMEDRAANSRLERLEAAYPGKIIRKGVVDPYEELSRAHLYLYPIKQPAGTFAFPLSLYESLQCGTPFLSSDIDGVNEFFDSYFLLDPQEPRQFIDRAREILSQPAVADSRVKKNLAAINDTIGQ
ncbi:MAG: glycosyltransferase [Candidatus Marinimicrobia bacterium]|nr:glycosyltransferase [Candidatus Neomarinimicrobiota bacterium]